MIRNVSIVLYSESYLHILIVFCIYYNSQKLQTIEQIDRMKSFERMIKKRKSN